MTGLAALQRQPVPTPSALELPRVLFGAGVLADLAEIVTSLMAPKRSSPSVLVVHGRSFARSQGRACLMEGLTGFDTNLCQHPSDGPTADSVDAIVAEASAQDAGLLVAVGGGAVMDAVKAAAMQIGPATGTVPMVIAIPTTPGSGAEATPFATLWDFEQGRKDSVTAAGCVTAALVDPDLCAGLPRAVLAASILDTLTQGAEAAWSTRSTSQSIDDGLAAVALVARSFEGLLRDGDDGWLVLASLAGHLSGCAIAVSNTTACHALSYPLTARYKVRHGHACGLSLCALLSYNAGTTEADCQDARGVAHVRAATARVMKAMGEEPPSNGRRLVRQICELGGLPAYSDYGVDDALVAKSALTYGRLHNNPRRIDEGDLLELLNAMRTAEAGELCF